MYKTMYQKGTIKFELIRKNIKNVYIKIQNGAVIVTAPKRISKEEIEKMLEKRSDWITKKLDTERKKEEKPDLYTEEEFIKIVTQTAKELIRRNWYKTKQTKNKGNKICMGHMLQPVKT